MKHINLGLLAHVDAGKTTLSEALLYRSGALRTLGRVDHGDAFLDTQAQEKERGITIFSKQAELVIGDTSVTLVDTPGHVDFSSEMERALQVLDYAVLIISGTDGVQSHTRTLWRLLERYRIPTIIWVNKTDLMQTPHSELAEELKSQLSSEILVFEGAGLEEAGIGFETNETLQEQLATLSEKALQEYLEKGHVSEQEMERAVSQRRLFPCCFGSALKLEGVEKLEWLLSHVTSETEYPKAFGARVYKVTRDPQGERLTWLKVTGGSLKVKQEIRLSGTETAKINQIRIYSGSRYESLPEVEAGRIAAVTGPEKTWAGQGLGREKSAAEGLMGSLMNYEVLTDEKPEQVEAALRRLEEEDPELHVVWDPKTGKLSLALMGTVQLEVIQRRLADEFGLAVDFGRGYVTYKETILEPSEGVGHFEPLRHYAEVHLYLLPAERGSGITLESSVSEDVLDRNWQRLIMTHLSEREFPGTLIGAPLTDVVIRLVAGRAHVKHTEGGDFREATYRAVRNGLLKTKLQLLEPWMEFELRVPAEFAGRALTELTRREASFEAPVTEGEQSVISGKAPAVLLSDLRMQVASLSRGLGELSLWPLGYLPCHNEQEIIDEVGYDALHDTENTGDSVFCSHGAGVVVPWNEVESHMHLPAYVPVAPSEQGPDGYSQPTQAGTTGKAGKASSASAYAGEEELKAIFEMVYGKGSYRTRYFEGKADPLSAESKKATGKKSEGLGKKTDSAEKLRMKDLSAQPPEILIVDGYNMIYGNEALKKLAAEDLHAARETLLDRLSVYRFLKGCEAIVVFDAYNVPRPKEDELDFHGIRVIFTKQKETADSYIERSTFEKKNCKVRVVTSDAAEQLIVLGHGAVRVTSREFEEELETSEKEVSELLQTFNQAENLDAKELNQKESVFRELSEKLSEQLLQQTAPVDDHGRSVDEPDDGRKENQSE